MAIDTKGVFCQAFNRAAGQFNNYEAFLSGCGALAIGATPNAINNARGAWYAWMLAIEALRFNLREVASNYLIKLPNITQFDSTMLYKHELSDLISDFKTKLIAIGNVNLVTSNPDYVIIRRSVVATLPSIPTLLSGADLDRIDVWYRTFISQCELDDIVGYVGAKFNCSMKVV